MPATGSSTSPSRTSVSTAPWPPLPWPVGWRSRPRRRSRKRRPRRPRPSPSSSPSSSGRLSRGPRVSGRLSDRLSGRLSARSSDRLSSRLSDRLSARLSGRLSDRLSARLSVPRLLSRLLSPPRLSARSRRPPRAGRPLSTDASAGASALVAASAAGASAIVPASAAGATASALWPLCSARRRWRCRRPPPSPSVLGASVLGAVLGSAAGAAAEGSRGPQTPRRCAGARRLGRSGSAVGGGLRVRRARGPGRGPATPGGAAAAAPFSPPAAGAVGAEVVSGNESCGAELPPDWRSLIAAMRSPLRMPVMSVMFSSPASWRSSASTMPESPRLRGAAVLTSSVSLKVVLPDLPGVVPGSANFTRDVGGRIAGRAVVPTGGTAIFATSRGKEAARPKPDPNHRGMRIPARVATRMTRGSPLHRRA